MDQETRKCHWCNRGDYATPFDCDACKHEFCGDCYRYGTHGCENPHEIVLPSCPKCKMVISEQNCGVGSCSEEIHSALGAATDAMALKVSEKRKQTLHMGVSWTGANSVSDEDLSKEIDVDLYNMIIGLKQVKVREMESFHIKNQCGRGVTTKRKPSGCAHKGCKFGAFLRCGTCGAKVCASHRYPETHLCAGKASPPSDRQGPPQRQARQGPPQATTGQTNTTTLTNRPPKKCSRCGVT